MEIGPLEILCASLSVGAGLAGFFGYEKIDRTIVTIKRYVEGWDKMESPKAKETSQKPLPDKRCEDYYVKRVLGYNREQLRN